MHFSNLKIAHKMALGFGAVLLLLAGIVGLALGNMASQKNRNDEIVKLEWEKNKLANTALDNLRGSIGRVFQITAITEQADIEKARERLKANRQAYAEALVKLAPLLSDAEARSLLAKAKESGVKYDAAVDKVLGLVQDSQAFDARTLAFGETYALLHAFAGNVRDLNNLLQSRLEAAGAASAAAYEQARNLLLVLSALALAAGGLAGWLVARSVSQPIGRAMVFAEAVAAGDLRAELHSLNKDETGQLLRALQAMNRSLVRIVSEVRQGTDTITTAAGEIASGNQDLSARTEAQAGALEETASSMEELTSTVKQNADNARQANQLAISASEVAGKGGEVVAQVVDTMSSINASSKKIVDIIAVIDGIAFQTNILALNAAVEAARAGEQGRGFAVVASEVRNLAQRSAAAAKEIKLLIGDSVEKVGAGTKLVDQAGETMQEVVNSIRRVTDIMGEITSASEEQRAGIEQVNQAITQMDSATQQNAALVEQAAAAAEAMTGQANTLAAAVGIFQLAGGGSAFKPQLQVAETKPVARLRAVPAAKPLRAAVPALARNDDWEQF